MNNHTTQWQLKGNAPKIYDQYVAPAVSTPWYSLLIKTGLPYMQNAIADVGCATGSFLSHMSKQKKFSNKVELAGIDLNAEMLAIAKEKIPTYKNNIYWVEADVEKLPFSDAYFNLIYCQQSIQYFKNKSAALREIHRVMNTKSALIATVWSNIENCIGYKHLADAVLNAVGDRPKNSLYAPFNYPDPKALQKLVESAGFRTVTVQSINNFVCFPSIREFTWHRIYGSPLIEDFPQNDIENIINEIESELNSSLRLYQGEHGLRFPVKANYLIAKK